MKRTYNSESRMARAAQTKSRILEAAKKLFQAEGFECLTIEKLAKQADVSAPTIYALFQSKLGIVRAVMDEALPSEHREALVLKFVEEQSGKERLKISAKIARQMYDAERAQIDIFRGASVLAPELKDLEKDREERRYKRQEEGVMVMAKEKILVQGMSVTKARDILWAFTGRDMYRMFVVQRGWSSDEYEQWLAQLLIDTLLDPAKQ